MTLVDSRAGIHAALVAFRAETGIPVEADAIITRLGPPVQHELLPLVGPDGLDAAVAAFRRQMALVGVQAVTALPGATEALAAVTKAGLLSLVITGKHGPLAEATLVHAGLSADLVVGDLWAAAKAGPLVAHHAVAYVGDHLGDIAAARAASVIAIGVATGPISAADLAAAGADAVLADLHELPAYLEEKRAELGAGMA